MNMSDKTMTIEEAEQSFEVQHLLWAVSYKVTSVRDTNRRMNDWASDLVNHDHGITIQYGPRAAAEYHPDPIEYYNRACSDYRITSDLVNTALAHFGVSESDRETLLERAIANGLAKTG